MTKSNSLAAALADSGVASSNEPCRLCEKLETLDRNDAEALRGALERGISVEDLYVVLRDNGHTVPRRHITKHRKGRH